MIDRLRPCWDDMTWNQAEAIWDFASVNLDLPDVYDVEEIVDVVTMFDWFKDNGYYQSEVVNGYAFDGLKGHISKNKQVAVAKALGVRL